MLRVARAKDRRLRPLPELCFSPECVPFVMAKMTSTLSSHSVTLHFIADLPKEASKDNKSLEIIISCNDQDYTYKMR